jgi:predicted nucleic acid-binding protein
VFLVDTNVVSISAPARRAHADLSAWMDRNSAKLFVSAVTIAEIEDGIAKAARQGARSKARALAAWLETVLHLYNDKVLPLDTAVARVCGRMSDRARAAGQNPGFADLIIAATTAHHSLTLLTRNVRHFAFLGVPFADPFIEIPEV